MIKWTWKLLYVDCDKGLHHQFPNIIVNFGSLCQGIKEEMRLKREILSLEDLRSRKFMANVLETRLARQKRESMKINSQAEKKIKNDPRLINILGTGV